MMLRAVLWDLDGTLVDSGEQHYQAWKATAEKLGQAMDRQRFAESFGKRNDTIIADLLGEGLDAAEVERIGDEKEELYRRLVREQGLELLPGAWDWLHRLKDAGWSQAVATSGPRANPEAVLPAVGLGTFFDAVLGGEDVTAGKPNPEIFLAAAQRVGARPDRAVVVEDAPAGLLAGRRARMRTIGVQSAHFGPLEADVVVQSLADLAADAFDRLVPP